MTIKFRTHKQTSKLFLNTLAVCHSGFCCLICFFLELKKNFTNLSGDHGFLSCETEHRLERLKKPIKEFRPDLKKLLSILAFNPLTSITVLHVTSSCNINTLSSETVSRIHKFI